MDKIPNNFLLAAAIIISSIILGIFFYASQVNKQKSIERQEEIKLQAEMKIAEAKAEQVKKEYVAKRRGECFDIYNKEKKNWANVKGVTYSEVRDVCLVEYANTKPASTEKECDKMLRGISEIKDAILIDMKVQGYNNCINNVFDKEF